MLFDGQAWTDDQIDLILSNENLFAYKTNNIYTLEKSLIKSCKNDGFGVKTSVYIHTTVYL